MPLGKEVVIIATLLDVAAWTTTLYDFCEIWPPQPVTFTVKQGGGSLGTQGSASFTLSQGSASAAGQTSVTVNSDSDGRVVAAANEALLDQALAILGR